MIYGKIIAGFLGFLALGVWGAVFGLFVGHLFDRGLQLASGFTNPAHIMKLRTVFFETSFQLLGYLAKADGRISEAEVEHTETIMRQLGAAEEQRSAAIALFKRGASPEFELGPAMAAFNDACRGQRVIRHTLLVFLIGLALADDTMHRTEAEALEKIAAYLGYNQAELGRLVQMMQAQYHFHGAGAGPSAPANQVANAYTALGADPNCSDRELKQAYRRLMSENHPDKLIAKGVPEQMVKLATARSQEILAAYELLKNSRRSQGKV